MRLIQLDADGLGTGTWGGDRMNSYPACLRPGELVTFCQLPFLLTATKDSNSHVRDTTAWTIGRVFEFVGGASPPVVTPARQPATVAPPQFAPASTQSLSSHTQTSWYWRGTLEPSDKAPAGVSNAAGSLHAVVLTRARSRRRTSTPPRRRSTTHRSRKCLRAPTAPQPFPREGKGCGRGPPGLAR